MVRFTNSGTEARHRRTLTRLPRRYPYPYLSPKPNPNANPDPSHNINPNPNPNPGPGQACMGVLRLMRAYTKREKVTSFPNPNPALNPCIAKPRP